MRSNEWVIRFLWRPIIIAALDTFAEFPLCTGICRWAGDGGEKRIMPKWKWAKEMQRENGRWKENCSKYLGIPYKMEWQR